MYYGFLVDLAVIRGSCRLLQILTVSDNKSSQVKKRV
jgi:hypothetical protein